LSAGDVLAAPPRPPDDISRFSSNTLFGEPGIYPDGPPMVPAAGPAVDERAARAALEAIDLPRVVDRLDRPELVARSADVGVRAALLGLTGTVAEPLLDAFLRSDTPVEQLSYGTPASPGRVVGPGDDGDTRVRFVNDRYRAEHPALLALSLTHDLLWRGPGASQCEEATLHALGAMTHVQLLSRCPALASTGTELARRQNSLAITLLNSRRPGSPDIALIAPEGPGTIPGGAPSMQTRDFWSIPFVGDGPHDGDAPPLLAPVLRRVLDSDVSLPGTVRYDDALGRLLSEHLGRTWLSLDAQWRAAAALGLVEQPTS
jgi:hypothetical protein